MFEKQIVLVRMRGMQPVVLGSVTMNKTLLHAGNVQECLCCACLRILRFYANDTLIEIFLPTNSQTFAFIID